jgi:hypothetical protein
MELDFRGILEVDKGVVEIYSIDEKSVEAVDPVDDEGSSLVQRLCRGMTNGCGDVKPRRASDAIINISSSLWRGSYWVEHNC